MRIKSITLIAVAICAAMTLPGYGSMMVSPTGWSNSGGTIDYNFDEIIDNSGLSEDLNTGDAVPTVLPLHETPGQAALFQDVAGRFKTKDATTTLTFDLGYAYELESLILWNGAEYWGGIYYNNRGLDSLTMSFSTDGVTFGNAITIDPTIIGEVSEFDAETFSIANVTARYVMFSDLVNGGGGGYAEISEVKFTAVTTPPSPPAWNEDPFSTSDGVLNIAYDGVSIADKAGDPNGDAITYSKGAGGPAWLFVSPEGDLTGTPDSIGTNTFTVIASDVDGSTPATLNILVRNPLPPVWNEDPFSTAEAIDGVDYIGQTLDGRATDPDGEAISYSKGAGGPTWLTVDPDGTLGGNPTTGDANMTNVFTVIAMDDGGASTPAELRIYVRGTLPPVWDVPVPIDGGSVFTSGAYVGDLAGTASDPDGGTIVYTKTAGLPWLTVTPEGAMSGTAPAMEGVNTFTISASDGVDAPITAELNISVIVGGNSTRSISLNLSTDFESDGFTGGQPIGPLSTDSANWNSTIDRDSGNDAQGDKADLVDDTGATTTADVTWNSANTWFSADGTASDESKISAGYLDDGSTDGSTGAVITVTDIPYANYKVYGLLSSGQNGVNEYSTRNFYVNDMLVLGGDESTTTLAFGGIAGNNAANGEPWTEISGSTTGNYWMVEASGSTLTISGLSRDDLNRCSICAVIIEKSGGGSADPATLMIAGPISAGTQMEISWLSEDGKPYRVETNSNLSGGNWQTFMPGITGNGGTITVTNDIGPDQTFYQVISE